MKKLMFMILLLSLVLCGCSSKEDIHKKANTPDDITMEPNKVDNINKGSNKAEDISKEPNKTEDIRNFTETSRPKLSENIYSFKKFNSLSEKDLSKILLIGFDAENYYFGEPDQEYYNYYVANKKDNSLKVLYKLPLSNDIFFEEIYDGKLLVGAGYWEDNTCHFQLISINKGKGSIIYKVDTVGAPIVTVTGNHVILNHIETIGDINSGQNEGIIGSINLDDNRYKEITSTKFTRNYPNYNGSFIMYEGGWDDGFCYEEVKMSNESIEEDNSGTCSIYYYSFNDDKSEKLIDFPHKLSFIRGDNECFITSDYLLRSNDNSGKITIRENGTYHSYDIPGVVSGIDIQDCYKLSDKDILVFNSENYWIYNLNSKMYYKEKYKYLNDNPENYISLDIKAHGRQFAYLEPNKNKIIVHTFTLGTDTN